MLLRLIAPVLLVLSCSHEMEKPIVDVQDSLGDPTVQVEVGPDGLPMVPGESVDEPLLFPAALPPTELDCFDGLDNDGDGPRDCADTDCAIDCGCTTGGGGPPGDAVMWWYDPLAANGISATLSSHYLGIGASRVDSTSVWPAAILDYRLMFIAHPMTNFNASQIADLQTFIGAGGTLVLIGEGSGYTNGFVSVFNTLHPSLGLSSTWVSAALDSGCYWTGFPGAAHALNTGVASFGYAYTSDMALAGSGVSVLDGASGQPMLAEENGVVFAMDTNMFADCGGLPAGNTQMYTNLWNYAPGGGLLDTDSDGVHDNCDQCPGYDDSIDVDGDWVPDDCDICLAGSDWDDADADTVPDACDACPGVADVDGDSDGYWVCDDCNDADAGVNPGVTEVLCDGIDNDCNALSPDSVDIDGDGVDSCLDCDDFDAGNFPGNPEACDGVDNDCDGTPDNGLTFTDYYPDVDGDLYGDSSAAPVTVCSGAPGGMVADGTDCDDTDPNNFPTNPEVCDGADNDCDGVPDNGLGFTNYYPDGDSDGYGDASGVPTSSCSGPPGGMVADSNDCDDTNAAVNPGETEVTCNALDDDCDPGTLDDPDFDLDGTGYCADCDDNDPVLNEEDLDGDGATSCDDDCDDTDPLIGPLMPELADGMDNDCDGTVDEGTIWYDDDGDGVTEAGGDCGDGDPTVYPGAPEICDKLDNDCDGLIDEGTECYDDDGDGFTELDGDCNDSDAAVNPNAIEDLSDGIDNDCDGTVDDGNRDEDGDGWAFGLDCDDTDPNTWPGAPEICDGIDNDCDKIIDEGTECFDDDGDGYTELDGDCDDTNDQIHPGATEIADGVDQDCDGIVDEDTEVSDDDGDGYSELDGDCDDTDDQIHPGAGDPTDGVDNDCDDLVDEDDLDRDQDGVTIEDGDCDDDDGWVHPGAAEVCDNVDNDCNGQIDEGCIQADRGKGKESGSCGCASGAPGGVAPMLVAVVLLARRRR